MSIDTVVRESEVLAEVLDPVVDGISDLRLQGIVDSAWYRLGSVNFLVRDQGGGALAAALARGLIEQAAYWDWAIAKGVGADHLDQWAALEYHNLSRTADELDDHVWLQWLLPPDSVLDVPAGPAIPKIPYDAVRRIGFGLDSAILEPLQFDGLLSAYRILSVMAHGNFVGAAVLADQPDLHLPDRLASIVIHLAAAGATAVAHAVVQDDAQLDEAATQFNSVAAAASQVHRLPLQSNSSASRPGRPAHFRETPSLHVTASAERMFSATPDLIQLGLEFLDAADALVEVVVSAEAWIESPGAWIPLQSFRLSLSNLSIIRGGLEGGLGKALMPIAARMLLEDGARWMWLRHSARTAIPGESLRALVNEGALRRDEISKSLQSDGVPQHLIDEFLGAAGAIPNPEQGVASPPEMAEMLNLAYPNPSGIYSAPAMYGVLSQFVHATPISNWHIRRDTFPTLTAPTFAISLEAAARGFERIASIAPVLAGTNPEILDEPLDELRARISKIAELAYCYHQLG